MEKTAGLTRRLLKSTSVVAMMTLLSRLVGFLRDVVLANVFGATAAFDTFVIAFKIPNFMRRLFAEGAFSQAFVPILSELRAQQPEETVQAFLGRVAGTLGLIVMLMVAMVEVLAPLFIMVFAPGFIHDPVRFPMATDLLRVTFPYLLLISLAYLCSATLNAYQRFALPAFTPVLLNLSMVLVAWFWAPYVAQPIFVLAWGVLLGGVLQLLIQLPYLQKMGLLAFPRLGFSDPTVRRVMRLMVPALFGVSVAQLGLLIDNLFASFLPVGSISWLYYADRLTFFPLGVIGVALATVVLPNLSRHHALAEEGRYGATLDWALRCALILGLPCAVGLYLLAGPIMATLFYHGTFSVRAVQMSANALMAFSVGLPAFMLIKILASGFYSKQNIKTPVKIAAIALCANLILNGVLVYPLRHVGLALATSLASWVNAALLLQRLMGLKLYRAQPGWFLFLGRVLIGLVVMGGVVLWMSDNVSQWLSWSNGLRSWRLLSVILMGALGYGITLWVVGLRLSDFRPKERV